MAKVTVPTYDALMNPVIQALKSLGGSGTIEEIDSKVAEIAGLTDEQLEVLHDPDKGGATEVEYRLGWSRTWLKRYGVLENSSRGVWALTPTGSKLDRVDPKEVVRVVRAQIKKAHEEEDEEPTNVPTWRDELLDTLLKMPPPAFERLAQRVLRESGFIQVEITGRSGDGGIDGKGIMRLGGLLSFHVIFQCKRWQGAVTAGQVRDFRGAMVGRADKGLLITTGTFTKDAMREATRDGAPAIDLVDLEKFLDRVNHDVLMGRLAKRIEDKRMLRRIRRYLEAGVMASGVVIERHEGTPQGGPLSPLLANVLLDEVDQELEQRGHAFVRVADDCNVYVRSPKAGARVLAFLRRKYARLRLRINEEKSAGARVITRQFLGMAFWRGPGGVLRRRGADEALEAMKDRVRQITGRTRGKSVAQVAEELRSYLTGWHASFRMAETPLVFRKLDEWIRHRLRQLYLKQWNRGRTIYRELRARGASDALARMVASGSKRWWHHAAHTIHVVLTNAHFDRLGIPRLAP